MKPTYEQVTASPDNSFTFRHLSQPVFDGGYHFHPETELTLITAGQGRRFVGTNVADFRTGDLVLVGSNLPHAWRSEPDNPPAEALVIQFREDFLGKELLAKPEFRPIAQLLGRARSGLHFDGPTQRQISREMHYLQKAGPFQRLLGLLDLLHTLALSTDVNVLDTSQFFGQLPRTDHERLNQIYGYMAEHFHDEIRLETVASLIHMTPQSFCRYFRKITRKTFVDVLTEYRIRYASQLLLSEADASVSDIGYRSGFGNISHFNRQFRHVTGQTPLQYRKSFAAQLR